MKKKLISLFLWMLTFMVSAENRTVYLVPFAGFGENIFDPSYSPNSDDLNRPFFDLRQELTKSGYIIKTTDLTTPLDDFAGLIVCHRPSDEQLAKLRQYPLEKLCIAPYGATYRCTTLL